MISLKIEQVSNGWIVTVFHEPSRAMSLPDLPTRSVFKTIDDIQASIPTLLADYFVMPATSTGEPDEKR